MVAKTRVIWLGVSPRMAVEDIGLADTRAQDICLGGVADLRTAWQSRGRIGTGTGGDLHVARAEIKCLLCRV